MRRRALTYSTIAVLLTGAAVGALADGGAGAAIAASGTEHLQRPAETRLQFTATAAVTVRP